MFGSLPTPGRGRLDREPGVHGAALELPDGGVVSHRVGAATVGKVAHTEVLHCTARVPQDQADLHNTEAAEGSCEGFLAQNRGRRGLCTGAW